MTHISSLVKDTLTSLKLPPSCSKVRETVVFEKRGGVQAPRHLKATNKDPEYSAQHESHPILNIIMTASRRG